LEGVNRTKGKRLKRGLHRTQSSWERKIAGAHPKEPKGASCRGKKHPPSKEYRPRKRTIGKNEAV